MLRFIFTLNVALGAAKRATFSRRKIANTWYERYIRHYVWLSLHRSNSFFMLTGEDYNSKWFPAGPKLLASTGVFKWGQSYETFGLVEKSHARLNFKHKNQTDLLANHHSDDSDAGQSQAELYVHFDKLTQVKAVEEIEIIEEDINKANPDIMGALDEYINADEQAEKDGEKPQNA